MSMFTQLQLPYKDTVEKLVIRRIRTNAAFSQINQCATEPIKIRRSDPYAHGRLEFLYLEPNVVFPDASGVWENATRGNGRGAFFARDVV